MLSTPLLLGHRGASALAPENTVAAFDRAMLDGADGIEFDVRLSSDHVPVVIHDDSLRRTGSVDRAVGSLSAVELQNVDVGSWFSKSANLAPRQSFAGERLPSLSRVFEFFSARSGILYVEMKCDPREGVRLAAEVARLILQHEFLDRVVVESFDLQSILEIKKIDAAIRTAALFEPRLSQPISTVRRSTMIKKALQYKADEIALHHTLAGRVVVEEARKEGLEVVVWTVDEPKWIERARLMEVKALISNNPGRMVQFRAQIGAS